jgi:hypothetical protein
MLESFTLKGMAISLRIIRRMRFYVHQPLKDVLTPYLLWPRLYGHQKKERVNGGNQ